MGVREGLLGSLKGRGRLMFTPYPRFTIMYATYVCVVTDVVFRVGCVDVLKVDFNPPTGLTA